MPATHINHALTKQRSCRLAKEKQELTRGGYSHVISTFSIFFVAPKSKIMSTAELGSNPEAQYDCAFPSTALLAECCALEDVADLSQLLHSPFPGAYSKGLHHLPTPTILTHRSHHHHHYAHSHQISPSHSLTSLLTTTHTHKHRYTLTDH